MQLVQMESEVKHVSMQRSSGKDPAVLLMFLSYLCPCHPNCVPLECPFCLQREFASKMEQAGFSHVTYENMTGGVVALHSGFKL